MRRSSKSKFKRVQFQCHWFLLSLGAYCIAGCGGDKAAPPHAETGGSQGAGGTGALGGTTTGGLGGEGGQTVAVGGAAPSSGCGKAPSIPSSQYNNGTPISISAAGLQRRYVLNVPTSYDNTQPYRLVVTLHARDGNDKQMHNWQYYGLLPESKETAIFVAPNGQLNGAPCSGNSVGESSCGWPNPSGQDLALVDAVVAQIEENFCIDKNRIFATGWSYGASMSYEVACERPLGAGTATWGVRAIAVYAGAQLSGACKPTAPVAYYASHGTHDSVLCYDSGSTSCQLNVGGGGVGLAQSFATANGCTWQTPTKVTTGAHTCTTLAGCTTGYPLEFCSFNGDHTPFPDSGQSAGSWGPQRAWAFLSQF